MMIRLLKNRLTLLLTLCFCMQASANEYKDVMWEELMPEDYVFTNPFDFLNSERFERNWIVRLSL